MVGLSRLRGVIATSRSDLHRLSRYYLNNLLIFEIVNFLLGSATGLVDLFIFILLSFERSINFVGSIPERTTAAACNEAPESDVANYANHHSLLAFFIIFIAAVRILIHMFVIMTLF